MRKSLATVALLILGAAHAMAQVPAGGEVRVNTYTTSRQGGSRAAMDGGGRFVVTWTSSGQDGSYSGVFGQRFREDGAASGAEFQVNSISTGSQALADPTFGRGGSFLVTWSGVGGTAFDIFGRRFNADGTPAGGDFLVNTYTTETQYRSAVASLANGDFVVSWSSHTYIPSLNRIVMRRYDRNGAPLSPEIDVASSSTGGTNFPAIASGPGNTFVIVWKQDSPPVIAGQRFDAAGDPLGAQFQANTSGLIFFGFPAVAMAADGSFVVVWENVGDGSSYGIAGRLFSASGSPAGGEFVVNEFTTGTQRFARVAADDLGGFVVSWSSLQGGAYDVFARRFQASGLPRSGDVRANTYLPGLQAGGDIDVDDVGNFLVTWDSQGQDGSDFGVFAQRFGGLLPAVAAMDTASGSPSDGNGVWEPGETVDFRPSWRNVNGVAQTFAGALANITGPPGAVYAITDGSGDYGTVANGATGACSDCYGVSVSNPPTRPAVHWDATAVESITPDTQGQRKQWSMHIGDSFTDVPRASLFYRFVEALLHHAVTGGCGATTYCPQDSTMREQMPVFVLVAKEGAGYAPPACTAPVFGDVPASSPFCPFIEELARRGVVSGCGGGNYCPGDPVTREQMAVFTLRTFDPALAPPACTTPLFADVPASSPYCRWIEELARRGVVAGCGGGYYCPGHPVTREQMAVFIAATFGLRLYGP